MKSEREKGKTMAEMKASKQTSAKHVSIGPEQPLHVHVVAGGEEIAHYIAEAGPDGTMRIYAAPEPAPPVQDPDPISGT